MIGDPTGQNKTRPALTEKEVEENAQTYIDQAKKILDFNQATIVNNMDWLGNMSFMDVIHLSSKITVAQMIERDDFSKRYQNNETISLDRKSTRLNSSHVAISYAVFCLKKK